MAHKLVLNGLCWSTDESTQLLSGAALSALLKSNELLQQGKAQCDELAAQAEALYQQNYHKGRLQGRAQAQLEYAHKLIESALIQLSALDGLETQLVEVVSSALDKIMGATEREDLIAAKVHQHLTSLRQSKLISLSVAPKNIPSLQSQFAPYFKADSLVLALKADESLEQDEMVVTTPTGSLTTKLELVVPVLEQEIAKVYVKAVGPKDKALSSAPSQFAAATLSLEN